MNTVTATLAYFLLARITEDEAEAREIPKFPVAIPPQLVPLIRRVDAQCERVLAECAAKRRIIELWRNYTGDSLWGEDVLRALALPYADHPDYREAWRP